MPPAHRFGDVPGKMFVSESLRRAHHVALADGRIVLQAADCRFIPHPAVHHRRQGQFQAGGPGGGILPVQTPILIIPNRKQQKISRQILISDGMAGIEILPAEAPALRDLVRNFPMKPLDPVTRGVMPPVNGTGVKIVAIEGGILPVHLLRHDHFPTGKMGGITQTQIIPASPGRPGQMRGAGIFETDVIHGGVWWM